MAKKKNRRLNIARKRAKRQQNQKSKRKQLAFQKQRALETAKSDEELLQDKIVKSKLLLDEPEFQKIALDPDLLQQKTTEAYESGAFTDKTQETEEETPEGEEAYESLSDVFRHEVLRHLITVEFINSVSYALKACETRLKRRGSREEAEIAFVARSLFEYADPETLAFHPLIFNICARTLKGILEDPEPESDAVVDVLSEVLEESEAADEDQSETPRDLDAETESIGSVSESVPVTEPEEDQTTGTEIAPSAPEVALETLTAKALYKNIDGLDIRETIEFGNGYRAVQDSDAQVEFAHTDGQRYITLTPERLLLQCASKDLLDAAMVEVETLCDEAIFYLARTVDDT